MRAPEYDGVPAVLGMFDPKQSLGCIGAGDDRMGSDETFRNFRDMIGAGWTPRPRSIGERAIDEPAQTESIR